MIEKAVPASRSKPARMPWPLSRKLSLIFLGISALAYGIWFAVPAGDLTPEFRAYLINRASSPSDMRIGKFEFHGPSRDHTQLKGMAQVTAFCFQTAGLIALLKYNRSAKKDLISKSHNAC